VICGVALAAAIAAVRFRTSHLTPGSADSAALDELDAAQTAASGEMQPPTATPGQVPTRRPSVTAVAAVPRIEKTSAVAEQAVGRLAQLDGSHLLTTEQAAAIKLDLQRLVAEGDRAIPAIRQFMQQNKDFSLDAIRGGAAVGYSSVRAALFDVLQQIGSVDARAELADTLRTTGDPSEVGLLAHHLETLAPGEYRQDILGAARDILAQAAGNNSKSDVAPLFQIFQTYGDANVLADLRKGLPQWNYYSLMTLAALPQGQGVPSLIEQSRQLGPGGTVQNIFAAQMLAQVAPQYPEAATALVDQVKAGQIPERGWRRIVEALAGDQYQFSKDPTADPATLLSTPGIRTFHMGNSNEGFYSLPLAVDGSQEDLAPRRALVDQLLAATTDPTAVAALQQAKARLGKPD
jgi:hypothetical protein